MSQSPPDAWPSTGKSCLRRLFTLPTAYFCLPPTGCGARLPDSGTLPPVTVAKNTPFYWKGSAEEVRKKGVRVDDLSPATERQRLTVDGTAAATPARRP